MYTLHQCSTIRSPGLKIRKKLVAVLTSQSLRLVSLSGRVVCAIRVLALTSSASSCEGDWSAFEFVHNRRRNRLKVDSATDLVYVFSNLRLAKELTAVDYQGAKAINWHAVEEKDFEDAAGEDSEVAVDADSDNDFLWGWTRLSAVSLPLTYLANSDMRTKIVKNLQNFVMWIGIYCLVSSLELLDFSNAPFSRIFHNEFYEFLFGLLINSRIFTTFLQHWHRETTPRIFVYEGI